MAQAGRAPRRESQPSRRARRVVALAAEGESERASAEAYNRAMQAYSQSPFTYQHEAGLCACLAPPRSRCARTRCARGACMLRRPSLDAAAY